MIHLEIEMGHTLFRIFSPIFSDRNFLYFRIFLFIEKLAKILACISPIFFFFFSNSPRNIEKLSLCRTRISYFFFFSFYNRMLHRFQFFFKRNRIFSYLLSPVLLLIKLLQFRGSKRIIELFSAVI